MLIKIK